MAASVASSHLTLPDLPFLRPEAGRRLRILHFKFQYQIPRQRSLFRIRSKAAPIDQSEVAEVGRGEEEGKRDSRTELDYYDWNSNGNSSNGSLKGILNGKGSSNGSLVKNADLNGTATTTVAEVSTLKEEEKRKKRVEDIGQEDAWFKRAGKEKVEV